MSSRIEKDLAELVKAGAVNEKTAGLIRAFYDEKNKRRGPGFLLIAFSILGSVLLGGGVILLLAHNWEDFGRPLRAFISFLPLVIAQVLALYAGFSKKESVAWREGTGAFLYLAIGISISLISQTYHISGNLPAFLFTWMLLGLPIGYLLGALSPVVLFLAGFVGWVTACEDNRHLQPGLAFYWPLLLLVLPYALRLWKKERNGFRLSVLLWVFSGALLTSQIFLMDRVLPAYWVPHFAALFSLMLLAGSFPFFREKPLMANPLFALGSLGMIIFLFVLSFKEPWSDIGRKAVRDWFDSRHRVNFFQVGNGALVFATAVFFWIRTAWERRWTDLVWGSGFILIAVFYFFAVGSHKIGFEYFVVNLYLLALGILAIVSASRQAKIGLLNYGMLILSGVVAVRFFDENFSFLTRGLAFIAIGGGFLVFNFVFVRKWKDKK
ncbi:MAG: DUF2157 domain-containing protein [Spirochaetia bacterium]|nr:DUF2157 domain-containing protein [Spirochaetia bacterium]